MSITNRIPALKGPGRRRAVDKVAELRDENRRLLTIVAGSDDAFMILRQQLDGVCAEQGEAEERVVQQQADIADLTAERDEWRNEALRLRARFGPQIAAEANAAAVDVAPGFRPIDGPQDQATGPIYVQPLWDALGTGPTAAVTDPGFVPPSWAREDDTVPVPVVQVEGVA